MVTCLPPLRRWSRARTTYLSIGTSVHGSKGDVVCFRAEHSLTRKGQPFVVAEGISKSQLDVR
eukprot:7997088-Lingulodinium_polyedra.AAC.1